MNIDQGRTWIEGFGEIWRQERRVRKKEREIESECVKVKVQVKVKEK